MKRAKNRRSPTLAQKGDPVDQLLQFMRRSLRASAPMSGIDIKALINEGRAGYKLSDLLDQCNPAAAPPVDMAAWENLSDVGREKLAGD